jgi:hypothetical protein
VVFRDGKQNELVSGDDSLFEGMSRQLVLGRAGHYLNFDLAFPSQAIPSDFFPSDEKTYGEFFLSMPPPREMLKDMLDT